MTMEKSSLEIAAASADPTVRGMAIRLQQARKEITDIENFLMFYAEAAGAVSVTSVAVKTNKVERKKTVVRKGNTKTQRMMATAVTVITTAGEPVQLNDLYDRLRSGYPDICPSSVESLRARLHENKETIARVDGRGYWPTISAVPDVVA